MIGVHHHARMASDRVGILQRGWRLHEVAGGGDVDAVKRLLRQGCFIDEVDEDEWTPLRHAVHYGQIEVATILVKAGANVDHRPAAGGKTALHSAAYQGRADLCELLLKHGADPNSEDLDGFVPVGKLIFSHLTRVAT